MPRPRRTINQPAYGDIEPVDHPKYVRRSEDMEIPDADFDRPARAAAPRRQGPLDGVPTSYPTEDLRRDRRRAAAAAAMSDMDPEFADLDPDLLREAMRDGEYSPLDVALNDDPVWAYRWLRARDLSKVGGEDVKNVTAFMTGRLRWEVVSYGDLSDRLKAAFGAYRKRGAMLGGEETDRVEYLDVVLTRADKWTWKHYVAAGIIKARNLRDSVRQQGVDDLLIQKGAQRRGAVRVTSEEESTLEEELERQVG